MKFKSYQDSNEEGATGLNTELLVSTDNISARSINRPIINLEENQESNYKLIQTLLRTVYGNSNGIIPGVFEEFEPEAFSIGSFRNDTSKKYIRIPAGMMLISKNVNETLATLSNNPFFKKGEADYNDNIHDNMYLNDLAHSYVIESKPEINLMERQLAAMINLDITDMTNDIKIYEEDIPFAIRVAVMYNGSIKYNAEGEPTYLEDSNSNIIYLAKEGLGNLSIKNGNSTLTTSNGITSYKINGNDFIYTVNDGATVVEDENGLFTSNIEDAYIIKDSNGNEKRRTGYYLKVCRATSDDDEVVNIPNEKISSHWNIRLDGSEIPSFSDEICTVNVQIENDNGGQTENISFIIEEGETAETNWNKTFNDRFYSNIISSSDYFEAYKTDVNGSEAICISSKIDRRYTDYYKISVSYKIGDGESIYLTNNIDGAELNEYLILPKTNQKYCTDMFELVNDFFGYYNDYIGNAKDVCKYANLDTIIELPSSGNKFTIYYDLNGSLENENDPSYDKTCRFYITDYIDNPSMPDNYIRLFDVELDNTSSNIPYTKMVKTVTNYFDVLDRRMISTKRAELNSLLATTRTDIKNYLKVEDTSGTRTIEITDNSENDNDSQTRIASPVLRIVDTKNDTEVLNPSTDEWTDTNNGDTPSDFFEKTTIIRDLETGNTKYINHTDGNNKGVIIDKNKGIKIFNNDETQLPSGKYSYSAYKPIEILSKKGNINIMNYDNNNGRINIRNLKDTATNLVDMLGKTRVRSKQDLQLDIRKIGVINTTSNYAGIKFSIGNSKTNNDGTGDITVGSLSFRSGTINSTSGNRQFFLKLSDKSGDTPQIILAGRNKKESGKVLTSYADFVPTDETLSIGFAKNSRTISTPTDTNILSNEGRWSKAFVKDGYFGKIWLADRTDDIINADARNGALNLGNSNIYNVSSIYINNDISDGDANRKNVGTINFDGVDSFENTISSEHIDNNNNYLRFTLKRALGTKANAVGTEITTNYTALSLEPTGTYINKNAYIYRQLFVNTKQANATNEDNSSFVVKGQSILDGEIIIGGKPIDTTGISTITRNKNDFGENDKVYKYYDTEFFEENESTPNNEIADNNYTFANKKNYLFTFVNKGRSLFENPIRLGENAKIEGIAEFQKGIVIDNLKTAGFRHNDDNYLLSQVTDNYYSSETEIPRHKTALEVKSGKIVLGSLSSGNSDASDLLVKGSQWTSRRLQVGGTESLIDTKMISDDISDDGYRIKNGALEEFTAHISPTLYISGASQFKGDLVFGGDIGTYTDDNSVEHKTICSRKLNNISSNGIKAIFWGRNSNDTVGILGSSTVTDYKTDFDFHGKTWLDGNVYIGKRGNTFQNGQSILSETPTLYLNTNIDGNINQTSGNASLSGTLNVSGNTKIGASSKSATLKVYGATTLYNTLTVSGNRLTTLGGGLTVSGATALSSTLGVTGATTLNSTLEVDGATALSSTLGVTGATTLSSTLGVAGNTTIGGALTVTGDITASSSTLKVQKLYVNGYEISIV